eukprot:jgi/Tetstr1/453746/TSEL_040699.t1
MAKGKTPSVGAGLRLDRFAAAKKSTYDKRTVAAKRTALNAKKVNKYRRLLKQLEPGQGAGDADSEAGPSREQKEGSPRDEVGAGGASQWAMPKTAAGKEAAGGKAAGKGAPRRKKSQLQRLAEQAEQEKREEAARQEEARKQAEALAKKKEESQKARRKLKSQFLKKTRHGQPVMKFRVDKILSQLQSK